LQLGSIVEGAAVNHKDSMMTDSHISIRDGYMRFGEAWALPKILEQQCAGVGAQSEQMMEFFAFGNANLVKAFLDAGADPQYVTGSGTTCLEAAIYAGRSNDVSDIVKLLLLRGANPNSVTSTEQSLLSLTLSLNKGELAKLLLDGGCDAKQSPSPGVESGIEFALRVGPANPALSGFLERIGKASA
jgi:hypothetical protein